MNHWKSAAGCVVTLALIGATTSPAFASGPRQQPPTSSSSSTSALVGIPGSATTVERVDSLTAIGEQDGMKVFVTPRFATVISVTASHEGVLHIVDADGRSLCECPTTEPITSCFTSDLRPGKRVVTAYVATADGRQTLPERFVLQSLPGAPRIDSATRVDGLTHVVGTTFAGAAVELSPSADGSAPVSARATADADGRFTITAPDAPSGSPVTVRSVSEIPADWDVDGRYRTSDWSGAVVTGDDDADPVVAEPTPEDGQTDPGFTAPVVAQPTPEDGQTDPGFTPGTGDGSDAGDASAVRVGVVGADADMGFTLSLEGAPGSRVSIDSPLVSDTPVSIGEDGRAWLGVQLSAAFSWVVDVDIVGRDGSHEVREVTLGSGSRYDGGPIAVVDSVDGGIVRLRVAGTSDWVTVSDPAGNRLGGGDGTRAGTRSFGVRVPSSVAELTLETDHGTVIVPVPGR